MIGVLSEDVPREGPLAPSFDDHPETFAPGRRWVYQTVPLASITERFHCPQGKHDAHCYLWTPENEMAHDVSPDDPDEGPGYENYDYRYVMRMAEHPEQLPALVVVDGGIWGGGHRTAAWAEAGWTDVPAWVAVG